MAERNYDLAGFMEIELCGPHDVIVTTGAEESVRAEGDEAALDALEIVSAGGRLAIGTRRRGLFGGRRSGGPVTVHVGMRDLSKASIAGAGDIRVNKVTGPKFTGAIAGSGDISIDEMQVDEAHFAIAGSGDIKAAGRAARAELRIAGSGDGDLAGLIAEDIEIAISGSGDVSAHATGSAQVSVNGSGDVDLAGGAKCTIKQSGSGNVRCS